jgi:hypothetical protein
MVFMVLAFCSALPAQDTSKSSEQPKKSVVKAYKINFNIFELEDGKRVNERNYILPVNSVDGNGRSGSIKIGTRVPTITSNTKEGQQMQYLDVGLNLDCEVTDLGDKFVLTSQLEVSSYVMPDQHADARLGGLPIIRQIREHFNTVLYPGKPTVVTSADDTNSKKRFQVEMTVTRIE